MARQQHLPALGAFLLGLALSQAFSLAQVSQRDGDLAGGGEGVPGESSSKLLAGTVAPIVFGRVAQLEGELHRLLPSQPRGVAASLADAGSQSGSGASTRQDPQGRGTSAEGSPEAQGRARIGEAEGRAAEGNAPRDTLFLGERRDDWVPLEVEAPKGGPLEAQEGPLEEDVSVGAGRRLALNPLDHLFHSQDRIRFTCVTGTAGASAFAALPQCPHFETCAALVTSKTGHRFDYLQDGDMLVPTGGLEACSAGFSDPGHRIFPKPPVNCDSWYNMDAATKRTLLRPFLGGGSPAQATAEADEDVAAFQVLSRRPELGCGHSTDFFPESPVAYAVYRLHNVYISPEAVVFNRSTTFLRLGCQDGVHRQFPESFSRGSQTVKRVGAVVNWSYRQGANFYHSLIESFPLFLSLGPIMNRHRSLPILGLYYQFEVYGSLLAPLVGVPLENMNRYEMQRGDLFRADSIIQPVYQICGHLSVGLWTELRRRHLLHPEGIPLFNPDWSLRPTQPLSDAAMAAIPEDWVVVVAQRPGNKRKVQGIREIQRGILAMFPPERVIIFRGTLSILEARALFRRTRLFVAGHGAAMSNMIFMPVAASVVEMRPDAFPNPCYHSLADACSLRYHLIFGRGTGAGSVAVDVEEVMKLVKDIAQGF